MLDPRSIAEQFDLDCKPDRIEPLGVGLINDTFVGTSGSGGCRFLLQRINQGVFGDVAELMGNLERVTERLRSKGVVTLEIIRTRAGEQFHRDPESGDCWRAFPFIEGTSNFSKARSPAQAEQAAAAFGQFARELADLPAPPLHETIPDFHNTPKRFADLVTAVEEDSRDRVASAQAEIDFCLARSDWANVISDAQAAGKVPQRVAHNDAKIENVLFDADGERAVCVIDLDTVMPGSLLHDFGDLVRSAAATAGEEERDLDWVAVCAKTLEALIRGYGGACGELLTPTERELLPVAGKLITFEQGLRFLSDYLQGDAYYRTKSPEHNLQRARNQLHLAGQLDGC